MIAVGALTLGWFLATQDDGVLVCEPPPRQHLSTPVDEHGLDLKESSTPRSPLTSELPRIEDSAVQTREDDPSHPPADSAAEFLPVPSSEAQYLEKYAGKTATELYSIGVKLREALNAEYAVYASEREALGLVDSYDTRSGASERELAAAGQEPVGMGRVQKQVGGAANPDGSLTITTIYITEAEYPDYFLRLQEFLWVVREWAARRTK